MEINEYQQKVLLEMLVSRKKDEQHIIEKLKQTIKHNEEWVLPIAINMGDERIIKGIKEVIRDAKIGITSNQKDLDQINDLINQINDLINQIRSLDSNLIICIFV